MKKLFLIILLSFITLSCFAEDKLTDMEFLGEVEQQFFSPNVIYKKEYSYTSTEEYIGIVEYKNIYYLWVRTYKEITNTSTEFLIQCKNRDAIMKQLLYFEKYRVDFSYEKQVTEDLDKSKKYNLIGDIIIPSDNIIHYITFLELNEDYKQVSESIKQHK